MRTFCWLFLLGVSVAACSSSSSDEPGSEPSGGAAGTLGTMAGAPAIAGSSSHAGSSSSAGSTNGAAGSLATAGATNAAGSSGSASGGAGSAGGAAAGSGTGGSSAGSAGAAVGGAGGAPAWKPIAASSAWQWQLTGKIDTTPKVPVFDVDLYDVDAATVSALHAKGALVICYVSVGSYEDWRPDAADFPSAVLGKDYPGWPGEKFLDIRALDTLGPILKKRMDLCKSKGFDGLEPDNMDVFEGGKSGTGFPLTEADGIAYARWLTTEAHARGLSIGQKNTSELAKQLATVMDWALTEDCFDQDWCADMQPYIDHGKAVLMSEYTDTGVNFSSACTWAKAHQFSAILKGRDLDAKVQFCP